MDVYQLSNDIDFSIMSSSVMQKKDDVSILPYLPLLHCLAAMAPSEANVQPLQKSAFPQWDKTLLQAFEAFLFGGPVIRNQTKFPASLCRSNMRWYFT